MKKALFLVICLLALTNAMYAQKRIHLGISGGANFNIPTAGTGHTGYFAGIAVEYGFPMHNSNLYLSSNPTFNTCSWEFKTPFANKSGSSFGIIDSSYNLRGLSIPFNIGYKLKVVENISLFINAGPYVNLKLSSSYKHMVTYAQCDNLYSPLSNDNFKENNTKPLSIGVGLKAGIILADKVQLHAGYNQGLSRVC